MTRVAINGLGRIGRATLKRLIETPELELVAINDLVPADNLAYLLRYDTVYGRYDKEVSADDGGLVVDGQAIPVFSEKDPENLPWKDRGVETVFECTGIFTTGEALRKHLTAGAKQVILSAPAKSDDVPTMVHGVNRPDGQTEIDKGVSHNGSPLLDDFTRARRRFGHEWRASAGAYPGSPASSRLPARTGGSGTCSSPGDDVPPGRAGFVCCGPGTSDNLPSCCTRSRIYSTSGGGTGSAGVCRHGCLCAGAARPEPAACFRTVEGLVSPLGSGID